MQVLKGILLVPAMAVSLAATIPGEPHLSLSLLAGDPRQPHLPYRQMKVVPGPAAAARFGLPRRLAYAGTRTGFPHLDGKWLVLDGGAGEVLLMDGKGTVERWLAWSGESRAPEGCAPLANATGLSVRPEGYGPWRAVVVDHGGYRVYEVDGKGGARILPGSDGIRAPYDAVIGMDGAVYVTAQSPDRIFRVQDGKAEVFAGGAESHYDRDRGAIYPDGKGSAAALACPYAITQDLQTGDLYFMDHSSGSAIRRLTLGAEVQTLAGARVFAQFEPSLEGLVLPKGPTRMKGIPCFGSLGGLTVREGRLYVTELDNHAIQVLVLRSGLLSTLAGDPAEKFFRPGPVRAGSDLPPSACAALLEPQHLAFDDQGRALLAMGNDRRLLDHAERIGACIGELAPTWRGDEAFAEGPGGLPCKAILCANRGEAGGLSLKFIATQWFKQVLGPLGPPTGQTHVPIIETN